MKIIRKSFRISDVSAERILQISQNLGMSETSTFEYLLEFYINNRDVVEKTNETYQEILHALLLERKYINELRRNEFVILDMLNTICIDKNISSTFPHQEAKYQSQTYLSAKQNCSEHLDRVIKQIKNGNKKVEE